VPQHIQKINTPEVNSTAIDTMWPKKNVKIVAPRQRLFDKFIHDVVYLILLEISLAEGKAGLLSVCLVSKYLYLSTIPHLYREVNMDLTRASHRRLLQ
jgi:hypothetical protein